MESQVRIRFMSYRLWSTDLFFLTKHPNFQKNDWRFRQDKRYLTSTLKVAWPKVVAGGNSSFMYNRKHDIRANYIQLKTVLYIQTQTKLKRNYFVWALREFGPQYIVLVIIHKAAGSQFRSLLPGQRRDSIWWVAYVIDETMSHSFKKCLLNMVPSGFFLSQTGLGIHLQLMHKICRATCIFRCWWNIWAVKG